jgi:hypothetical protein
MPDPALGFFEPTDPIDINTLLSLTGSDVWEIQAQTPNVTKDRAQGLAADGDEGAYTATNEKTAVSITYKSFKASGYLTLPTVGDVASTYHIDAVKLTYNANDWPTLEVQAHKHTTSTHTSCNEYTVGKTSAGKTAQFPAGFGAPASIVDDATPTPATYFAMAHATIGVKTVTVGLAVTHQDETGSSGDHLAGENRDGKETLDADFVGIPTTVTAYTTFTLLSCGGPQANTAADTARYSYERHVLRD